MAMPNISSAQIGDLHLLMYEFAKACDTLPMHNHTEATSHIIIVARGRVMLRVTQEDGSNPECSIHGAGTIVDTAPGFPHEVIALEDDSKTIHMQKNLVPKPSAPDTSFPA